MREVRDRYTAWPVYRETGMPVLGLVDFNYSLESWHLHWDPWNLTHAFGLYSYTAIIIRVHS